MWKEGYDGNLKGSHHTIIPFQRCAVTVPAITGPKRHEGDPTASSFQNPHHQQIFIVRSCGGCLRAELVVFGDGNLGLGWPKQAAGGQTSAAPPGNATNPKLEQGRKKKEQDLDPRRSLYLPIQADANESEKEGEVAPQGLQEQQREEQSLRGFQLHQIHHNRSSYFSSSSSSAATASSSEYACLPERIGEGHSHNSAGYDQLALLHHHHQQQLQRPQPRSRHGGARGGAVGEIVEVQGGHIVRSTGRKDRHSKVCTAKGPRDRRVRLSAHTAIQFYDVQDRLGYDRPSKAVDWLMKNAKAAIDELAELPPWSPSATVAAAQAASSRRHPPPSTQLLSAEQTIGESSSKPVAVADPALSTAFSFGVGGGDGGNEGNTFLPPSLDTDSIADTIKSFFPMAAAATPPSSSPSIGFLSYSPELPSRTSGQAQDLRLSLQSFQDPIFHNPESGHHHHHHHSQYHQSPTPSRHDAHFPSSAQLASDAAGWAEQSHRIAPWNMVDSSGGGGGYVFSFPPPQAAPLHSLLGQSLFFSQRGPLQSSNSPAVRAWADPVDAAADHRMQPALYSSMPSIGFASGASFPGFRIPARIQGEEEHDGHNDKPPSAASASRH
ncbi:unnamed protein product [Musa banksii]